MVDMAFAHNRFGLGPRADEPMAGDPKAWLRGQLEPPPPFVTTGLPGMAEVAAANRALAEAPKAMGDAQPRETGEPKMPKATLTRQERRQRRRARENGSTAANPRQAARQAIKQQVLQLAEARLDQALVTPRPFAQRLVYFWSNHFATSTEPNAMGALPALLEDDAIRPNIFGKFEDLLLAVTRHPAMLVYLDQFNSVGPGSQAAARGAERGRDLGLNENLAREILELHTLGVRSGYSQADVVELAKGLTGWAFTGMGRGRGDSVGGNRAPGSFVFVPAMHEPGARTLMGQRFAQTGEQQAEAMLRWLARHPATARHLATKMARHFVADDPPAALVSRLEDAYAKSNGDLEAMTQALIDSPEAWQPTPEKFRSPWGWMVAALRGIGLDDARRNVANGMLGQLGQPTWEVPSPAGWGDKDEDWAGPDALMKRVDVAQILAERARPRIDARTLAPKLLGQRLSEATATQIARAESAQTGIAILLASPEMLRR